jgi:hypothetical protein
MEIIITLTLLHFIYVVVPLVLIVNVIVAVILLYKLVRELVR